MTWLSRIPPLDIGPVGPVRCQAPDRLCFGQRSAGCARLDEARLVREDDGLDAVAEPELPEDARDMRLHGRLADEELLGDLGVREASRDQLQDLDLARGQLRASGGGGAPPRGGRRTNSSITRRVIEGASSASPLATARIPSTSCSGGTSLSRKPLAPPAVPRRRTRPCRTSSASRPSPTASPIGDQLPGRLDAVELRHADVHQHDVWLEATGLVDRLDRRLTASPTTSMSGSASRIIRKPARTSAWSSAIRTRTSVASRAGVDARRAASASLPSSPSAWSSVLSGGNDACRPGRDLEDPDRPVEVLQPLRARSAAWASSSSVLEKRLASSGRAGSRRRCRPSRCGRHDASESKVAIGRRRGVTGVDPHPHSQLTTSSGQAFRPASVAPRGPLDGVLRAAKRDEERVALRGDPLAAGLLEAPGAGAGDPRGPRCSVASCRNRTVEPSMSVKRNVTCRSVRSRPCASALHGEARSERVTALRPRPRVEARRRRRTPARACRRARARPPPPSPSPGPSSETVSSTVPLR